MSCEFTIRCRGKKPVLPGEKIRQAVSERTRLEIEIVERIGGSLRFTAPGLSIRGVRLVSDPRQVRTTVSPLGSPEDHEVAVALAAWIGQVWDEAVEDADGTLEDPGSFRRSRSGSGWEAFRRDLEALGGIVRRAGAVVTVPALRKIRIGPRFLGVLHDAGDVEGRSRHACRCLVRAVHREGIPVVLPEGRPDGGLPWYRWEPGRTGLFRGPGRVEVVRPARVQFSLPELASVLGEHSEWLDEEDLVVERITWREWEERVAKVRPRDS